MLYCAYSYTGQVTKEGGFKRLKKKVDGIYLLKDLESSGEIQVSYALLMTNNSIRIKGRGGQERLSFLFIVSIMVFHQPHIRL